MTIYLKYFLPKSIVSCLVLTVASWPVYRFLRRHVRWSGSRISWRIFHSLLWSTQLYLTNNFSASLSIGWCKKLGLYSLLLKISIWNLVLPVFPEHKVHHSCPPPCIPFRAFWRLVIAVANDLVLGKPGGKWHSLAGLDCWRPDPFPILQSSLNKLLVSPVAQMVKHLAAMWETQVWSLCQEDPLEKEMATHSSTLAWKIPLTEDRGRLQSMGLQGVGHSWTTSLSFFLFS